MSLAAVTLRKGVRRVVLVQCLLTLLVAFIFGYVRGMHELISALYGGGVAIVLSLWLARGASRVGGLASIFANVITRYAAVVLFMGLGMGLLHLAPLPLLAAFALAQLGFVTNVHRI
jgi:ATP synthase protein I